MPRVVQLPVLSRPRNDNDPMLVEFGLDWDSSCRIWRMILAMAVRDAATAVQYHPWRPDGHLAYVRAGVRHSLVPPPPELARQVMAAAGSLICGTWFGRVSWRLFRCPLRASGRVMLAGEYGLSEWAGVVWSAGPAFGADWYLLDEMAASSRAIGSR